MPLPISTFLPMNPFISMPPSTDKPFPNGDGPWDGKLASHLRAAQLVPSPSFKIDSQSILTGHQLVCQPKTMNIKTLTNPLSSLFQRIDHGAPIMTTPTNASIPAADASMPTNPSNAWNAPPAFQQSIFLGGRQWPQCML